MMDAWMNNFFAIANRLIAFDPLEEASSCDLMCVQMKKQEPQNSDIQAILHHEKEESYTDCSYRLFPLRD